MPKLHLRTFQKKAYIDGDGTVVFPNTVELNEGVIPDGGTLTYEANGTDLQTQVTANTTAVTALQSSGHAHVDTIVYVDSNRSGEVYTETGSFIAPYRTLSSAIDIKLADGETDYVVFQLAAGTYTGTISRDKETQEQRFEIRGSGKENTILQGATGWDATTGDILYFRDFIGVKIRDLSIRWGKYGIYTRNCVLVDIENVQFTSLGSSGANHVWGGGNNQAQMASFWAAQGNVNAIRSNGGIMRIRDAGQVIVRNCDSSGTLRGIRLQNCHQGRVSGCTVRTCLEAAYYCASTSYSAANGDGCHNIIFETCRAEYCWNNAFLVIGGYDISIIGCQAQNVANSAVMGWHTQDLRVQGCVFNKTCLLDFNGIGNQGDAWGCVGFRGNSGLTDTEGFMLTAVNNIMFLTGQGRHVEPVAFWFGLLDETLTSFRAAIEGNNIDLGSAAITYMDDSIIPLTKTKYPDSATQAEFDILETSVGTNGTAIALNGTNITTAQGNISTNAASLVTNTSSIATKQNTLTWSTVADDHETNPVSSKEIKSYVDANSGGSGATLGQNTFTGTQKIETNVPVLELIGANQTLQISAGYGPSSLWVGEGQLDINGDRVEVQATSGLRMPRFSSDPTLGTNNSRFGCVYYNTTSKKLFFHDDSAWVELATV